MTGRTLILSGLVAASLTLSSGVTDPAHSAAVAPPPPPPDPAVIDAVMARDGIAGLAAGVTSDGAVAWSGVYGYRDIDSGALVDDETVFLTASVSKTIVATAVMQLYEQGLIDLDADIDTYLPFSLRHPGFSEVPITVRMLLTHRSGLAQPFPEVMDFFRTYPGDSAPPLYPWIPNYLLPGGNEYMFAMWRDTHPGDVIQYSNMGGAILGYLVEVVGGQDFGEYCADHIFAPLDMPGSGFRLADVDHAKLSTLYIAPGIPFPQYSVRGYPATMLRTSLSEFAHFVAAILNRGAYDGGRILEPESVDEMLQIAHPDEGLALLWWSSGGAWMGHGGNFYGSTARLDLDRSRNLGLVILSNVSSRGAVQPGGEIYDLVRRYARAQNLVCPAIPSASCASGFERGVLLVDERRVGREKLVVKWKKGPSLSGRDFGNPLEAEGSAYTLCVYDDAANLVGQTIVDRPGDACRGKACWNPIGKEPGDPRHRGYRFRDVEASADGTWLLLLRGGGAGKSRVLFRGINDAAKGRLALPTGIASALAGSESTTVQLHVDDAPLSCVSQTLPRVVEDDGARFMAKH